MFARKLAAQGYGLLLVARRKERLEQLAAELGNARAVPADLSAESDVRHVEAQIRAEQNLEFLVNNAGFGTLGRFWEGDIEGQDNMHRVHVTATIRLTHAALRGMIARRRGNIINVSSVAAFLHNPFSVGYGASKAWMNSFTEALHVELRSVGSPVRVQALCPGFTYSEFHDRLGIDRGQIPRSLWMSAEDVVNRSLLGLVKNELIVIPGWRYRLFVGIGCWLPRFVRHAIALKYGAMRNRR
jgi:short-subunit dehydrogenase